MKSCSAETRHARDQRGLDALGGVSAAGEAPERNDGERVRFLTAVLQHYGTKQIVCIAN